MNIGSYVTSEILGQGKYGKVYLATNKEDSNNYAIKVIRKSELDADYINRLLKREISLMQLLNHPNLQNLIDLYQNNEKYFFVLDYCAKGSLFDLLEPGDLLDVKDASRYFRQIIYGLEYLHSCDVCHRDLKAENILITEDNNIKIADFGFAKLMKSGNSDTFCGSPHYVAPEVVKGQPYDAFKADVWSCGVILFALCTSRLPFSDVDRRKLFSSIKKAKYIVPDSLDERAKDLIKRLLVINPSERLTIEQIKNHPFIRIGLPDNYELPKPISLPNLSEPIPYLSIPKKILSIFNNIGFSTIDEIKQNLESKSRNSVKNILFLLTSKLTLDQLPWNKDQIKHLPFKQWKNSSESPIRSHIVDIPIDNIYFILSRIQKYCNDMELNYLYPYENKLLVSNRGLDEKISLEVNGCSLYIHQHDGSRTFLEEFILLVESYSC